MNERQRRELLARIQRASGRVGRSMPETVEFGDESIPVREFYFEVAGRDELGEEDRETVEEILSTLRRKRSALVRRIRNGEVDYATGRSLVPEIRDLDRAINAFESLDGPDFDEQLRQEKIESARRLLDLMRQFGKK